MNNLHVKTGDNVMIISGKDKGHTGKVLQVSPSENKVIVEGQNMVTKHVKPRRQGEQGGIVKAEGAMVRQFFSDLFCTDLFADCIDELSKWLGSFITCITASYRHCSVCFFLLSDY